jgi:hypothetical protein
MKKCTKCGVDKHLDQFSKKTKSKDGLNTQCKGCVNICNQEWRENNPNKIKENSKDYYLNNKDKVKEHNKNYYLNNKDKVKVNNKRFRENNPNWDKEYRENNPNYLKEWLNNNPNKVREYNLGYRKEYERNRNQMDPIYKLTNNTRTLIWSSFKNCLKGTYKKGKKTEDILGCTLEEFIQHLRSQFLEGMTLENHGGWEMDHIKPISLASTEEEIYELNHYTNFQPLWKEDNRKKSNKTL